MVQFVKAIVEEASLKGFDVLWADAQERRMCDVGQKWDRTDSSRVMILFHTYLHTITQLAELGM